MKPSPNLYILLHFLTTSYFCWISILPTKSSFARRVGFQFYLSNYGRTLCILKTHFIFSKTGLIKFLYFLKANSFTLCIHFFKRLHFTSFLKYVYFPFFVLTIGERCSGFNNVYGKIGERGKICIFLSMSQICCLV